MIPSLKLCLLLFCFAISTSNSDRCASDEECKNIRTCEEKKFFLTRNVTEIRKLKVCGSSAGTTEYCCSKVKQTVKFKSDQGVSLASHKNINLINNRKCGKFSNDRIIGGSDVKVGSMPWMALLNYKNFENVQGFKCGGSLISPKYVLTAAHCDQIRGFNLFAVRLGEHRISTELDCVNASNPKTCNTDKPPIQDIEIEKTIVHENFAFDKNNDIALLLLKSEVILTGRKFVGTICLPVRYNQTVDAVMEEEKVVLMMTVAGWGYSEKNVGNISDVLKFVEVPYVPNKQCNDISENLMCAGGNKADACSGDSGGPLTCFAQNDREIYKNFQQGIVSRGTDCATTNNDPGIYTRIFSYVQWILDNLEE